MRNERKEKKKKGLILALVCAFALVFAGCGTPDTGENASTSQEGQGEKKVEKQEEKVTLEAPVVNEPDRTDGEDGVTLDFTWEPIENADGYEVEERSKYINDDVYQDPIVIEQGETVWTTGGQDEFDFSVKVRAYKGEGADRVYSEWSNKATGSTRKQ